MPFNLLNRGNNNKNNNTNNDNKHKNNNSIQDKFKVFVTNDGNLNGTIEKS